MYLMLYFKLPSCTSSKDGNRHFPSQSVIGLSKNQGQIYPVQPAIPLNWHSTTISSADSGLCWTRQTTLDGLMCN